jgi:membrane-associated protein
VNVITFFTDLFLHADVLLKEWVAAYGAWIYAVLFLIIFIETGVVIMPFLPGDSIIFTAGAIAAVSGGGLNIIVLFVVLFVAAVLGDALNYTIGRRWGRGIIDSGRFSRIITTERLARTEAFFRRHGGKTISLARFFPFIRTFAPFVAGVSRMDRLYFTIYNVIGAAAWVALFLGAGYLFGNIPFVEHNLEFLVMGIIAFSLLPAVYHWTRQRLRRPTDVLPPSEQDAA